LEIFQSIDIENDLTFFYLRLLAKNYDIKKLRVKFYKYVSPPTWKGKKLGQRAMGFEILTLGFIFGHNF
jgi:hypothetical protein